MSTSLDSPTLRFGYSNWCLLETSNDIVMKYHACVPYCRRPMLWYLRSSSKSLSTMDPIDSYRTMVGIDNLITLSEA
jgi:hypothetical protein